MWSDHPLFGTIAPGQEHQLELDEKDGNPNPNGGFYKDRTVLKPGQTAQPQVSQMRNDTNTQQKLDAALVMLRRIEDKIGSTPVEKVPGTDIDYPQPEITEEDSPF